MAYDPDLPDRMEQMEPDLLRLLTNEITSLGRWDVLRFFLESDSEQATMDEIGSGVGRDSEALLAIMGELTAQGWLARRTHEGETYYLLTQERDRRLLLDRLRSSLHERTFRLQAIYHWTRGGGRD